MVPQDRNFVGVVYYDLPTGRERSDNVSHSFLMETVATESSNTRIVVAEPNWRTCSRENFVRIDDRRSAEHPRVGFFRMEGEITKCLREALKKLFRTDASKEQRERARRAVSLLLRGYIKWRFPVDLDVREHGVFENEPGLDTVTYDKGNNRKIGIHLDSWDGKGITERQVARTRFSVNLGPDVRHFLWVPYTVEHIVSEVHGNQLGPRSNLRIGPDMLLAFVRHRKAVPVVRLELQPFEGYIADTDNLFHDASSVEAKLPTYHYSLRSFYIGRA